MEFWHYNKILGIQLNKKLGNTNTSNKLADFVLNIIDFNVVTSNTRFLEPAVGGGSFYFAMIEALLLRNFSLTQIVEEMIYAYDIDENALGVLRQTLSTNYNYVVNSNTKIFHSNFLTANIEKDSFDYIITNPPYISNKNVVPDKGFNSKDDYLSHLRELINPNINKISDIYMYFYIKSLNLLRQEGKLIYLCSDSWVEAGFGNILRNYIFSEEFNLDLLVNNQLYPFFRDDTNAILTVISRSNKNVTKILNLRQELTNLDFSQQEFYSLSKDELKSIYSDSSIINHRNALILFFDYYFNIYNFFLEKKDKFEPIKEKFNIDTTIFTQSEMVKQNLLLPYDEEKIPLFWQIQSRINQVPNYKVSIASTELKFCVDLKNVPDKYQSNIKWNNFYMSSIIDRYPLFFNTPYPTFHVSKYFSISPIKKTKDTDNLLNIVLFNNIYSLLDMELRLKEGTRKTLRKGELGLAKEVTKQDFKEILIPKDIDLTPVLSNIHRYSKKIIYNIESALLDEDYIAIQKHITKAMGFNDHDLKTALNNLLFLYILRMRNIKKINDFSSYTQPFLSAFKL